MINALRKHISDNVPKNFYIHIMGYDKKISKDILPQNILFVLPQTRTHTITGRYLIKYSVYLKGSILDNKMNSMFLDFNTMASDDAEIHLHNKENKDKNSLTYMNSYQCFLDLPSFINSYKINSVDLVFNRS